MVEKKGLLQRFKRKTVKVEEKIEPNQLSFDMVKKELSKDLKKKEEDKRKAALLEKLMATAVIIK